VPYLRESSHFSFVKVAVAGIDRLPSHEFFFHPCFLLMPENSFSLRCVLAVHCLTDCGSTFLVCHFWTSICCHHIWPPTGSLWHWSPTGSLWHWSPTGSLWHWSPSGGLWHWSPTGSLWHWSPSGSLWHRSPTGSLWYRSPSGECRGSATIVLKSEPNGSFLNVFKGSINKKEKRKKVKNFHVIVYIICSLHGMVGIWSSSVGSTSSMSPWPIICLFIILLMPIHMINETMGFSCSRNHLWAMSCRL
jgi:hypothetical protein